MSEKEETKRLKLVFYLVLCLLVLFLFSKCFAFPKNFGPYEGVVVDMEIGEPIEGAIVFFEFMTVSGSVGGPVHHYGDSLDVFTDKDGKFSVPETKIPGIRFGENWEKQARLLVYKPGYWNFPYGKSKITAERGMVDGSYKDQIFNNTNVTIELKKLRNKTEIEDNLLMTSTAGIPLDKSKNIRKLISIDRVKIGLSP